MSSIANPENERKRDAILIIAGVFFLLLSSCGEGPDASTYLRYSQLGTSSLTVVNLERQVIDEKASANLLLNRPMSYHREFQMLEQAANNIELLENGSEQLAKKFDACIKERKLALGYSQESFWLPGEWQDIVYDIFMHENQVYFTRSDIRHQGLRSYPCDITKFFGIYTIEGDQTRQVCLYYDESKRIKN